MLSRRDLLKSSTFLALAPTVPAFLARTARAAQPQRDGRLLVVHRLDGGNDGINTVVPFADEGYAKHRKALRLPKDRLVKVSDAASMPVCWKTGWGCRASRPWAGPSRSCRCSGVSER